jgi:hypothetical protein
VFLRRTRLDTPVGRGGPVDIAFTDRHGGVSAPPFDTLDLSRTRPGRDEELRTNMALLATAFEVEGFATMSQVHGADVAEVDAPGHVQLPCDAMVTTKPDVALCVRVGDCAPVVLADVDNGVIGVAHAGRPGVAAGVVPATVTVMRDNGAERIEAWVGPRVCGGCYEVPAVLRDEIAGMVPAAYACTTWGSPSLDIGAAVRSQLTDERCTVHDIAVCTRESPHLYSHRRDGAAAGRFAGIVVRRGSDD